MARDSAHSTSLNFSSYINMYINVYNYLYNPYCIGSIRLRQIKSKVF